MREALAAGDGDFALTAAAPNPEHSRAAHGSPKRRTARSLRRKGRRIAPYLTAGFFAAALVATLFNALLWQRGRHSGPLLFSRAEPPGPAKAPKANDTTGARPRRGAPAEALAAPKIAPERSSQDAGAARGDAQSGAQDQIAKILQRNEAPPPPAPGSEPAARVPKTPAPDKAVLEAQRALVKLGFVLKADGIMGAATRKAIARYERSRGRASDGALTPALIKRLAAEAGISAN